MSFSNLLLPNGKSLRVNAGDRAIFHKRGGKWVLVVVHHTDAARLNSVNRFTKLNSENKATGAWVNFGSNWGGVYIGNDGNTFTVPTIATGSGTRIAYLSTKEEGTKISLFIPQKSKASAAGSSAFEWEVVDGTSAAGTVPAGYTKIRVPGGATLRTGNADGIVLNFIMANSRWVYSGSGRDTELMSETLAAFNANLAGTWVDVAQHFSGGTNNWVFENVQIKRTSFGFISFRGSLYAGVVGGSPAWPQIVAILTTDYRPAVEQTFQIPIHPEDVTEGDPVKPVIVVHVVVKTNGEVRVFIPANYTDVWSSEAITIRERRVHLNIIHYWKV